MRIVGEIPTRDTARTEHLAARILLLALVAFILIVSMPRFDARFGASHDGRNAAMWGLSSRAIRDDGLVASRLGALRDAGTEVYAHHPPLISLEVAASETVFGEHRWSTRLPAWLSVIAAIALLYQLALALGIRPLSAAVGVTIAFAGPWGYLYGPMLDTPEISLPLALGVLLLRQRRSARPDTRFARVGLGVLAFLAAVSGWEAMLLVGVVGAIDSWRTSRARKRPSLAPVAIGAFLGIAAVAGWLAWAAGGFSDIADQLRDRSGNGAEMITWGGFLRTQFTNLRAGTTVVALLLLVPAFVAIVVHPRTRRLGAILLAVTLAYPLIVRDAAYNHIFWNYWWMVPLALGIGVIGDAFVDARITRGDPPRLVRGVLVGAAVFGLVAGALTVDNATGEFRDGVAFIDAVTASGRPTGTPVQLVWTSGSDLPAAQYEFGSPNRVLLSGRTVVETARTHPDLWALYECRKAPEWLEPVCPPGHPWGSRSLVDLAAAIDGLKTVTARPSTPSS